MKFQNLIQLYERKKKQYGKEAFKYISQILQEAKKLHKRDWLKNPTPNKDHEQSWRSFKGKNLEKWLQLSRLTFPMRKRLILLVVYVVRFCRELRNPRIAPYLIRGVPRKTLLVPVWYRQREVVPLFTNMRTSNERKKDSACSRGRRKIKPRSHRGTIPPLSRK